MSSPTETASVQNEQNTSPQLQNNIQSSRERPNLNVFNVREGEEPFIWRFNPYELSIYKYFFDMYKATFGCNEDPFTQENYLSNQETGSKVSQFFYSFIDLFWCLRPSKISRFFVQSGIVNVIALIIMQLQILSLVLLPNLAWDKKTQDFLFAFSFIRTGHLHSLYVSQITRPDYNMNNFNASPNSRDVILGEIFNYLIPFIFSLLFTTYLFLLFIVTYRFRWNTGFKLLSFTIQLLPALYIPVLSGYLNTINCYTHNLVPGELNATYCFDGSHIAFAITSLLLIIPFIVLCFILQSGHYEWKPTSQCITSKAHARFDMIFFLLVTALTISTVLLQIIYLFLIFLHIILLLTMLAVHVYYMQYYRHAVNQIIMVGLIISLLSSFVTAMVLTLMLFYGMYDHYVYGTLGLLLIASIVCGIVGGIFSANLRVQYMGTMIHEPSGFQRVIYQLQANEVLVPRGEYEVEMAARVMHSVSGMTFFDQENVPLISSYFKGDDASVPIEVTNAQAQEARARNMLERMGVTAVETQEATEQVTAAPSVAAVTTTAGRPTLPPRVLPHDVAVERVDEMYRTALEMVHSNSLYVYICYATFIANILQQYERGVMILTLSETEFQPLLIDLRFMVYIRKKTWLDVIAARRNAQTA